MGPSPKGPFDVMEKVAIQMLKCAAKVNGRPNSDVIRRVQSGADLTTFDRDVWTTDFRLMKIEEAAAYESPFQCLKTHVHPVRSKNRRKSYAEKWWQYAEARPGMRSALSKHDRFVATPEVSQRRWSVDALCGRDCGSGLSAPTGSRCRPAALSGRTRQPRRARGRGLQPFRQIRGGSGSRPTASRNRPRGRSRALHVAPLRICERQLRVVAPGRHFPPFIFSTVTAVTLYSGVWV